MFTGGNIFKSEDNVCNIGEYFGTPEDYADGGVCTGGYSSYYMQKTEINSLFIAASSELFSYSQGLIAAGKIGKQVKQVNCLTEYDMTKNTNDMRDF